MIQTLYTNKVLRRSFGNSEAEEFSVYFLQKLVYKYLYNISMYIFSELRWRFGQVQFKYLTTTSDQIVNIIRPLWNSEAVIEFMLSWRLKVFTRTLL